MRSHATLIAFGLLSGCWYDQAQPTRPKAPEPTVETATSSYRATTLTVDAIGVAAMTAGMIGLHRGHDEDLSGGLLVVGLATAGYVSPIIHLARGNKERAGGSWLIRSMATTTGMFIGYAAGCGQDKELFCGFEGMLWGVTGGLAFAGALDAILLHGERSPRTWTPTITPGDGGARVGILGAF